MSVCHTLPPGLPAYFVGPWDLNRSLACVPKAPTDGTVVLVESIAKSKALPFHRQKLVLVRSAMRHFAEELQADGYDVTVLRAPTYVEGILRHLQTRQSSRLVALRPREWALDNALRDADFGVPIDLHDDGGPGGHFLLSRAAFSDWAKGREHLQLDTFYRFMRRQTGWLMDGDKPIGGKWSFDAENRKPVKNTVPPKLPRFPPDNITTTIADEVATWDGAWGPSTPFIWPVCRKDALVALQRFVDERLCLFGDYQDAMVDRQPFLWHACLSPALNLGLLTPSEVIEAAISAYEGGKAPLNSVEGFVRQVLGWREFIRGVYWHRMPALREANALDAHAPLPRMFYEPKMAEEACVRSALDAVWDHGYAHHIQRLMVLGNLTLLLGVAPREVSHWFWAAFVDAYEWVELPNVHGMALAADPTFTSKPYAASGAYIQRMSNHCRDCRYDVKQRAGRDACPFNALFWDFMVRHRERLSQNPRLAVLYKSWDRWTPEHTNSILQTAAQHKTRLCGHSHSVQVKEDNG